MSGSPLRHGKRAARPRKAAQRFLALLREGRDVRRHLVQRVRAGIRAGDYENELKLEVAVGRVVEAIGDSKG